MDRKDEINESSCDCCGINTKITYILDSERVCGYCFIVQFKEREESLELVRG